MAAAADRLAGDVLEIMSPELVLVDASLREAVRLRLEVPEDTLSRITSVRFEPHSAAPLVTAANNASTRPGPVLDADSSIDDLIVLPPDERPSSSPELLDRDDGTLPETLPIEHAFGIGDLVVQRDEALAETKTANRMYPPLPSPPEGARTEDPTDVVLRQIRDHFEPELPVAKQHLRLLSLVPTFAALSALALLALDEHPVVSELVRWLPS